MDNIKIPQRDQLPSLTLFSHATQSFKDIHVGIQLFTTFGKTDLIKDKRRTTYARQTI